MPCLVGLLHRTLHEGDILPHTNKFVLSRLDGNGMLIFNNLRSANRHIARMLDDSMITLIFVRMDIIRLILSSVPCQFVADMPSLTVSIKIFPTLNEWQRAKIRRIRFNSMEQMLDLSAISYAVCSECASSGQAQNQEAENTRIVTVSPRKL